MEPPRSHLGTDNMNRNQAGPEIIGPDHVLEIGTVVELKMMNGECLDPQIHGLDPEYTLEANWEVEVLELWFTVQMRDFLQVPRECIGFVWSNDHELDIAPQAKVSATVCWGPAP